MKYLRFCTLVLSVAFFGSLLMGRAAYAQVCDEAFTKDCFAKNGMTQSGNCGDSGRKYIDTSGSAVTIGSTALLHCGGPTGLWCCALSAGEICTKNPGASCRDATTCGEANECFLTKKSYTTYDAVCLDAQVCCAPTDPIYKVPGCVAAKPSAPTSGATAKPYDEKACDAAGGLCGSSCGSSEIASPSVSCGEKGGVAYACCLDRNTCTEGGGSCADACPDGSAPVTSDTACAAGGKTQVCCKSTTSATGSASTDAAKAGASGSSTSTTGKPSPYGSLSAPSPGAYHPPVTGNINSIIGTLILRVLPLIGSVMLLMFFYGGVLWMTAAGDAKAVAKAQSVLTSSVIGIVIISFAFVLARELVRIIGASLS